MLPEWATLAVAEEYLDRWVNDGFTAMHVRALSKEVGRASNVIGDGLVVPLNDILKANEPYWRHLDALVAAAENQGLLVALRALWLR
jgi:hypothetical protein